MRELTPGEQVVIDLIFQGKTHRAIATELNVSRRTVSFHVANVYRKLGVHTAIQARLKLDQIAEAVGRIEERQRATAAK